MSRRSYSAHTSPLARHNGRDVIAFSATLLGDPLNVRAREASDVTWLQENLPGFAIGPEDPSAPTVELMPNLAAPMDASHVEGEFSAYAFESNLVRLPGWHDGGTLFMEHERFGARLGLSQQLVQVWRTRWDGRLRLTSLRALHELAMASTYARAPRGTLQVHAACLEWEGSVIALLGAKFAGKTTTVSHVCASLRAPLIANDHLLVTFADGHPFVRNLTSAVSVRAGTLERLQSFQTIPNVQRPLLLTLREYDQALAEHGPLKATRDMRLSMSQLARELGTTLSAGGPLTALVVLEVDPPLQGFHVTEMTPRDSARAILEHRFGVARSAAERTVFHQVLSSDEPPVVAAEQSIVEAGIASVRGFRARIGSSFLDSDAGPRLLIDAVTRPANGT